MKIIRKNEIELEERKWWKKNEERESHDRFWDRITQYNFI